MPKISNIVLVHGGFVDGAGWRGVHDILKKDGFNVSIVQNPTISLAGDVSATKLIIASQPGPMILVGHSYGGVVITEAGTDPKVAGLVYITAFAPDKGESVNTLIANPPPGAPVPPILPPKDGYLFLDKVKFPDSFAGDVDPKTAVSWPTPRYRGASTPLAARSQSRLGNPSLAGISKSAMTR
jgi:pimeloyl-ACP methyl ester carboxylesterase